jgi:hypothetical protein
MLVSFLPNNASIGIGSDCSGVEVGGELEVCEGGRSWEKPAAKRRQRMKTESLLLRPSWRIGREQCC